MPTPPPSPVPATSPCPSPTTHQSPSDLVPGCGSPPPAPSPVPTTCTPVAAGCPAAPAPPPQIRKNYKVAPGNPEFRLLHPPKSCKIQIPGKCQMAAPASLPALNIYKVAQGIPKFWIRLPSQRLGVLWAFVWGLSGRSSRGSLGVRQKSSDFWWRGWEVGRPVRREAVKNNKARSNPETTRGNQERRSSQPGPAQEKP